jgi:hypothetical protein
VSTSRGGNQRGLELLRRWARIFDSAFRIPGTRITFGLDPIIGLIPGIGDLSSPIFSLFIIWHAAKLRVPRVVIARMVLNALIDGLVGAIPVVGDLFDFAWKASAWNLALLERHAMPSTPARRSDWIFVALCVGVVVVVALIPLVLAVWLLRHVNLF